MALVCQAVAVLCPGSANICGAGRGHGPPGRAAASRGAGLGRTAGARQHAWGQQQLFLGLSLGVSLMELVK